MLKTKNGIMIAVPNESIRNILTFTTCRFGGFSEGVYSNLNMGFGVNENIETVRRNHKKVAETFGIKELARVNQVHGSRIHKIEKSDGYIENADGLFTEKSNLALAIMTADCFSVQLIGNKAVANLHCGWRSIYSNIMSNAFQMFEKIQDKINTAVVGIGICEKCYEVSEELAVKFSDKFGINILKDDNGNFFLDLRKIIVQNLLKSDIKNILHINYCSKCDSFLYSHRRDKGKTGRMMSVLMKYD